MRSQLRYCTIWYMNLEARVRIDAPATLVWELFTDVRGWPSFTPSVTSVEALEDPDIAVGRRFRIKQPKLPTLIWEVSAVAPAQSWTWVARSVGVTTTAAHHVTPTGPESCLVTQIIDQRGPLSGVAGLFTRRMTRRYLSLEGNGLKAAAEQQRQDAP